MLVILVGAVMLLFGVLRLGSIMGFVSTAVMTGFTTGIAVQIVAGVLGDATAYEPESSNTVGKIVDWLAHIGSWDPASTAVAGATIAVWALTRPIRPLRSLATLVALAVVVVAFHIDVRQVADIASIQRNLPGPILPNWSAAPTLIAGAVAVALVGLAQAAGIGAAVPNPDRSRTKLSADFSAQGTVRPCESVDRFAQPRRERAPRRAGHRDGRRVPAALPGTRPARPAVAGPGP